MTQARRRPPIAAQVGFDFDASATRTCGVDEAGRDSCGHGSGAQNHDTT